MHDTHAPSATPAATNASSSDLTNRRLGPLLCWAVVFADIGTSVYYVPGILYNQVGRLAGLFVIMTLLVFLLLTLKYAEVSVRFPEGGGVVTVAARGLSPWAGAVGGMFILVDYFLTSAISSLSGLQYLGTLIPWLRGGLTVLLVTIVVVALLGVLNWYGIRESAKVSFVIASAALLSDAAILVTVFLTVPLGTIADSFREIFSGKHLTGTLVLTGFAGAFLAFSGLESISQLSPVMRAPRKRTVSFALAIVVVTVGVTSPLLTIFSTTLLDAAHTDPNTFISSLAGFSGGQILSVLTAITASTLLIFASNTAIIGAYHVFVALAKMHFLPTLVERVNKLRGTPHWSIILATGIPMLVLVAVQGQITILGDMYAFGLLGAFSLTCLSLDVIRWRERHGGEHIGDTGEEEMREYQARRRLSSLPALSFLMDRTDPATMERFWHLRRRVQQRRQSALAPLTRASPNLRYYLGFLTTALVMLAWGVNLFSKPLATAFGGSVTIVGVTISVVHYRYQRARGNAPVFLMSGLRRMPQALLVVLSPNAAHNLDVVRAAVASADGHTPVFLYLASPVQRALRQFEIADPYSNDAQARLLFSQAATIAEDAGVHADFLYRVGGPSAVFDVWRILRPSEIIAEADIAKQLAKQVAPEYVRFQTVDGVRVAHYIKRAPADSSANGQPSPSARGERTERDAPTSAPATPVPELPQPATSASSEIPQGAAPDDDGQAAVDIDDYVWTGTELVRRSELPSEADAEPPHDDEDAKDAGTAPPSEA